MSANQLHEHFWLKRLNPNTGELLFEVCGICGVRKYKVSPATPLACQCKDCLEKAKKQERFLSHSFFTEVKKFCDEIEIQQILKGAEKYPHPFNPDDWDVEQLANHAMSENRDQAVYITGMRDRMRKQAEQIETLKAEVEYWRLKAEIGR